MRSRPGDGWLRAFHQARPGCTSSGLARNPLSYDRLAASVARDARVLDLACGDRFLLDRLGPRAIGVDLAPSRASAAAPRAPAAAPRAPSAARLVAGRAQALPFAAGSFDACVCHLAFMLFDDLERIVDELHRVVVPGGTFAAILGGGPTASPHGDDAFHRFLATAPLAGRALGDPRARSEAGWRQLFGAAPSFERIEVDLSGRFDDVWAFLGTSYQLTDAPAARAALAAQYAPADGEPSLGGAVPCRVVFYLATVALRR